MKKLICYIVISLFTFVANAQQITTYERSLQFEGLKALYESIENGNKDILLGGWDFSGSSETTTYENWEGITTDVNGYVTIIDISNKGLIAEFTKDILTNEFSPNVYCWVNCPKLRIINFSGNFFNGYAPSLFYSERPDIPNYPLARPLPYLETVIIDNNNFNMTLFTPSQCISLKNVRASHNNFTLFNFNSTPWLEYIDVSHNSIGNSTVVITWDDTTNFNLNTLDISNNNIRFGDLWRGTQNRPGYHNINEQNNLNLIYYPQNKISLERIMINDTVRSMPGNSITLILPDVGQRNSYYPMIRDSLTFEWYRNDTILNEYTTDTLNIENFSQNDIGTYYCKIYCSHPYMNDLILETDTFKIIEQPNENPELTIREGDQQYQRILKGSTSSPVKFIASDDMPLDHYMSRTYNTFRVIKETENLEYLGDVYNITVRDTSETWIGNDTIIVEYCDFEGGCVQDTVFYEVYDYLYTAPLESLFADTLGNLTVSWDLNYYNDKIEQPTGYYIVRDTCPQPMGMGEFTTIDTINVNGGFTNSFSTVIPQSNSDYMLFIKLYAQKDDSIVSDFSSKAMIPMPVKADTIVSSNHDLHSVTLSWNFRSDSDAYGLTNYNAIYYSVNNSEFQWLTNTTYNMSTYIHENIITDSVAILSYKLVKRAVSMDMPPFDFELPYLQSNIVTIPIKILDNDATLLSLTVSEGELTPSFHKDSLNYVVEVPYEISSIILAATSTNINANISGTGEKNLIIGDNIFEIEVIAEDEITTQIYSITVIREDNQVGINNLEEQTYNIKIYPNPTTNELVIETGNIDVKHVIIRNSNGKITYENKQPISLNSKFTINIGSFESGIYIVEINTPKGILSKKIIKN